MISPSGRLLLIAFFLLCALPTCVMTALVTPPGQSPDEAKHLARAAGLLHGAIVAVKKPDIDPLTGQLEWHTGVKVDTGLLNVASAPFTAAGSRPVITEQDLLLNQSTPADPHLTFVNIPNTATYFPVAYLPATLGLAIGLAARVPPYDCFLLARFCMLLTYAAVGAAALWLAAYGEALLLTVLLLPMTLFLGGTLNQDGLLTAMTCLSCAALTRDTPRFRILGLTVFTLVLGSKPPYAFMIGAFLLPMAGPGLCRRVRDAGIALIPVILWVAFIAAFVVVPYSRMPYPPGPFYHGPATQFDHADVHQNLAILIAHPSLLLFLPLHTLYACWWVWLWGMIGILGPLQLILPHGFIHAWEGCILAALLGAFLTPRARAFPAATSAVNSLVIVGLLVLTCWLILIMFYLDWTDIGGSMIGGIQGRYLLILLPFLLFALPPINWPFTFSPLLPALPTLVLGLWDIGYLPLQLVQNYFLH